MVGFSSLLDAQADLVSSNQLELVSEEISLFSDRELYIAGETMWFSLAIKNRQTGSLSIASKVAYVDLVGSTGVVMTRVKIEVISGKGSGSIDLSEDLTSGYYKLRSYTQAMRNFGPDAFEEQTIIVLNADQPIVTTASDQQHKNATHVKQPSDVVASISMDKLAYSQRERVQLVIELKDKMGRPLSREVALSVANGRSDVELNHFSNKEVKLESNPNVVFLPEDVGMHLSGQLQSNAAEQSLSGIKVFLAFPGERAMVYSALTNLSLIHISEPTRPY